MNERLQEFINKYNIKPLTEEEKEVHIKKLEEDLNKLPEINYIEAMKELARIRGKDENHYLD